MDSISDNSYLVVIVQRSSGPRVCENQGLLATTASAGLRWRIRELRVDLACCSEAGERLSLVGVDCGLSSGKVEIRPR